MVRAGNLQQAALLNELERSGVDVQLREVHRLLHLLLLPLSLLVEVEVVPHGHLLVGEGGGGVLVSKVPS